jgi:2-polyprenyl-3-methyl-5-hydroxy-6-metoxy-1,4-benzoquinol methylase
VNGPRDDWDSHWGKYAEASVANPAGAYRGKLILASLGLGTSAARVLDIGSGQGDLLRLIRAASPAAELLGVDLSEAGCAIGREKVPGATFIQRDLLDSSPVPAAFARWATHAVCSEVLEHVDAPALLLRHAMDFLQHNCRVVVTVPSGPMSEFDRQIGHRRHYTKEMLHATLTNAGLEVQRVMAAGFPFHNIYRLGILARGRRLAGDLAGPSNSAFMLRVMRAFDLAFRMNLTSSPWGWQLLAVARMPE